jgi:hypothetical protein
MVMQKYKQEHTSQVHMETSLHRHAHKPAKEIFFTGMNRSLANGGICSTGKHTNQPMKIYSTGVNRNLAR